MIYEDTTKWIIFLYDTETKKYYCNSSIEVIDNTIISVNDNNSNLVINDELVSLYPGEVTSISPDALAGLTKVQNITFDLTGLHLTKEMLSKMEIQNVTISEKVTFDYDALSMAKSVVNMSILVNDNLSYTELINNSTVKNITVYAEKIPSYFFKGMTKINTILLIFPNFLPA